MALKKHTGIKVKLQDITETFGIAGKPSVIFGGYYPRPSVYSRRGTFLQFDMPDSTTILIANN